MVACGSNFLDMTEAVLISTGIDWNREVKTTHKSKSECHSEHLTIHDLAWKAVLHHLSLWDSLTSCRTPKFLVLTTCYSSCPEHLDGQIYFVWIIYCIMASHSFLQIRELELTPKVDNLQTITELTVFHLPCRWFHAQAFKEFLNCCGRLANFLDKQDWFFSTSCFCTLPPHPRVTAIQL